MLVLIPQHTYADALMANSAFGTKVRGNAVKAIEQVIPDATNKSHHTIPRAVRAKPC